MSGAWGSCRSCHDAAYVFSDGRCAICTADVDPEQETRDREDRARDAASFARMANTVANGAPHLGGVVDEMARDAEERRRDLEMECADDAAMDRAAERKASGW